MFDLENRLKVTTLNGVGTTTYSYDGDGNRASAVTPAKSWDYRFSYDSLNPLSTLALERKGDASATLVRRYVNGPLGAIGETDGASAKQLFYGHDPLGSVTDATSATGASQWAYAFEAFGKAGLATKW